MKLVINKDRSVIPVGTWGTVNENNYEILDFEFPAELDDFNKRIVYYLGNERVWDAIVDNKAYITNAITTKEHVKAYVWLTERDDEIEKDIDFRTQLFEMNFYENENADGIVPTPQQIDGFNTMLTTMNAKIDEVDALEQTIGAAEAQRQENENARISNESTRESNESTRQTNEETRQSQEAERERRTDEAIAQITDMTQAYNQNAQQKTEAFNQNATNKTNDFNDNASSKKSDFNSNAESKTTTFNNNASSKTSDFNTNATNKTNAFDSNASSKTTSFNNNATSKTTDFNTNAENKTTAFNSNATDKTTNFDNNANSKTTTFNENATSKTNDFNDNATAKTTDFNNNAQAKIDEYDAHIVDYQAQIDDLTTEVQELSENMPWAETEQGTYLDITDAAKYSKNKMKVFGNTEQASYSGNQLIDIGNPNNVSNTTLTFNNDTYVLEGTNNAYCYANYDITNLWINNPKRTIKFAYESLSISAETMNGNVAQITVRYTDSTSVTYMTMVSPNFANRTAVIPADTSNVSEVTFRIYTNNTSSNIQTNTVTIVKPMLQFGTEDLAYEPYVGGVPAPNSDYPQQMHVVTGNNTARVTGKNLLDTATSTNGYIDDNGILHKAENNLLSDYISVQGENQYTISLNNIFSNIGYAYYDKNKNFVSRSGGNYDRKVLKITVPAGIKYIKIWFKLNNNTKLTPINILQYEPMFEKNSTDTSYEKHTHQNYPLNLGNIELCKIVEAQDFIFKNTPDSEYYDSSLVENGWYKYGAIRKYNECISSSVQSTSYRCILKHRNELHDMSSTTNILASGMSKNTNVSANASVVYRSMIRYNYGYGGLSIIYNNEIGNFESGTEVKNWFDNNEVVYVVINTSVDDIDITQITDETLISQLDAIYNHLALVKGTNHITITPSDLEPYVTLNYMQDLPSKLDNLDSRLALLE